jgi:apolipoprotein D and lipocalin family protein
MRFFFALSIVSFIGACTGVPENIRPVGDFDLNRYLGTWYEIARLDHSFERGLDNVYAEYTLREDGGVKVINRGYSKKQRTWKQAEGKAYFVRSKNEGYLKVTFFGPFYSSYVIFELDSENYSYAFVTGYNNSYLWLLSRNPVANASLIERFIREAKELGFDTDELIFVDNI